MISVVIPVYNVEKYLDECIQSVIDQSYTDFECILIDDGSTDLSGSICDKWAKKDCRIKVIHQRNQGVSAARNAGIDAAIGEYITFVDSDDFADLDYLECLVEMTRKGKSDLCVIGVTKFFENGDTIEIKPKHSANFPLDSLNADKFIDLNEKFLLFGPCAKLYSSSIIRVNQIQFPLDYDYGEDLIFNYKYLDFVNSISCENKSKYHYRILNNGNTLSSKQRNNQFEIDYKQWLFLKDFYVAKGLWSEAAKRLLYRRLWGIVYDGVVNNRMCSYTDIKRVLSIPEIRELKYYKDSFICSGWIKFAITHRCSLIFRVLNFTKKL